MRILVVDDQGQTRESLKLLLNTLPSVQEVQEAENGLEAVRLIPVLFPCLVVMDAYMPVMDGVEATRIIKANWPQVKVIMLSMYLEYQGAAQHAGADAFVSKGEPPEKILEAVCAMLELNCETY